ncbi:MAG: alpha-soluble NSF attachment protein 2-like [Homavirus sp.]|uniref:Gamma-soluble NSF attachment protein n=1 Tax=Homavirus sp. TaxID=2487769 RepID=A0A3G5A8C5_9VIRU|nr:MAG: alpha-soluble NSF attachment protein 2-like [Homavirus sp.]
MNTVSGYELFKKANNKENSWFKIFYSKYDYENIADVYRDSGTKFRMNGQWDLAINAYLCAIRMIEKTDSVYDTIEIYENIAIIYHKNLNDIENAIKYTNTCINICSQTQIVKPINIARMYKTLANLYEQYNDLEKAISCYDSACNIYDMHNNYRTDIKNCLLRMAELYCKIDKYNQALQTYIKLINLNTSSYRSYVEDSLLLKVILCYLIIEDIVGAKQFYEKYSAIKMSVTKLIKNIILAIERNDGDIFKNSMKEYLYNYKFDNIDNILISKIDSVCFDNRSIYNDNIMDKTEQIDNSAQIDKNETSECDWT